MESLSGYGDVFYQNVLLSGVVPQIAVVCGPCAGGAAYSPALMDFVIMTRNAHMFITRPEVIKAVPAPRPWRRWAARSCAPPSAGTSIHRRNDRHALDIVHRLLSSSANNTEDPPHRIGPDIVLDRDEAMNTLLPTDPAEAMDIRRIIEHIVDGGALLEVYAEFTKNIIVGFARIEGLVIES